MPITEITDQPQTISVTELNQQARQLLEQGLSRLWVEGEVSNLSRPASGHVYFTLKDKSAQLRCAWFRQRQRGPTLQVKNGDQMMALGKVSIYETRGDYQMIVERMRTAGKGDLKQIFEALKTKLSAAGLFDTERKKGLPKTPQKIGVITSPSGAAIRDILSILKRRFPAASVVIYPSSVQGDAAAGELVTALETASTRAECDVLLVTRGGGSLEDLWPFNEELVARAIADCPIPVVSAVGHEIDFTIADFVADVRAATPSAAAELVVPDATDWIRQLAATADRFRHLAHNILERHSQTVDWLGKRLTQSSPSATVARQTAWLENLSQMMAAAMRHSLGNKANRYERTRAHLLQQSPALKLQSKVAEFSALKQRLRAAVNAKLQRTATQLQLAARALHSVSPLATLDRGYSIISLPNDRGVLTNATDAAVGDLIDAQLADGRIEARVMGVSPVVDSDE